MGNRKYFLLGILFSFSSISAQQLQNQDAVSVSLSGTDIVCSESPLLKNPAQVHRYRQSLLILNYANLYMLPELSTCSVAGIWSRERYTFSGTIGYFGSRILNEVLISLGYGQEINPWLDAGIRMNYWRRNMEVFYESQQILSGEVGIRLHLPQNLHIGMHLVNPAGIGYPGNEEHLESYLCIGLGYSRINDFYLGAQISLTDFRKPSVSTGLGYFLVQGLVLRCGMKISDYLSYSFGLGTTKGRVQMDLGICQHTFLGPSVACTVSYKIAGE